MLSDMKKPLRNVLVMACSLAAGLALPGVAADTPGAIPSLAAAPVPASVGVESPPAEPVGTNALLLLGRAIRQPFLPLACGPEDLAAKWPAFEHEPFETAGFNQLMLPFHAEGKAVKEEAHAFSFLLSNALDWTPGSYCSRHAYFVFKRDWREMQELAVTYDRARIRNLHRHWRTTHAIGGTVSGAGEGYAGTLQIFDCEGALVHTASFPEPRAYFDLLGDMSVACMRFFGHEPSALLDAHLRRKRCESHRSILDLGAAAFAEERSGPEFRLYRLILARDPGFAEVRFWASNQGYWQHRNASMYNRQKGLALKTYLVEAALSDFRPSACPDKALAALHPQWVDRAERMLGPASPTVLDLRLDQASAAKRIDADLLRRALATARRYPNEYHLLYSLSRACVPYEGHARDYDMVASVALAALCSRYSPSSAGRCALMRRAALAARILGYNDMAVALLAPALEDVLREPNGNTGLYAREYCLALENMGHYAAAARTYMTAVQAMAPGAERHRLIAYAAIDAAVAGDKEQLEQIVTNHRAEIEQVKMNYAVDMYTLAMQGKEPPLPNRMKSREIDPILGPGRMRLEQLCAMEDIRRGTTKYRELYTEWLGEGCHSTRPLWIIFDAYDRLEPKPESGFFYGTLEWLHGDDPWVVQAVCDYRARTPNPPPIEPDRLLKRFAAYEPLDLFGCEEFTPHKPDALEKLPPGKVAAAVWHLIKERQFDKAEELAQRAHHCAVARAGWSPTRVYFFRHVVQKARQARKLAPDKSP